MSPFGEGLPTPPRALTQQFGTLAELTGKGQMTGGNENGVRLAV
jgi:hypothetical protein